MTAVFNRRGCAFPFVQNSAPGIELLPKRQELDFALHVLQMGTHPRTPAVPILRVAHSQQVP